MRKKIIKFCGKKYVKVASATGCKLSKIIVVICLVVSCASCTGKRHLKENSHVPVQIAVKEQVKSENSMYFSSEYVTETLHQGATGYYYIVYDDIDAGMDYELLQVDVETFRRIEAAMSTQKGKLRGYLIEKDGQFTYCHGKDWYCHEIPATNEK